MDFKQRYELAENGDFQIKVKGAVTKTAIAKLNEDNLPKHLINYSQLIINKPNGNEWVSPISHLVTSNVAITEDSTDNDIEYTVAINFEKLAKAYYYIVE